MRTHAAMVNEGKAFLHEPNILSLRADPFFFFFLWENGSVRRLEILGEDDYYTIIKVKILSKMGIDH